MLYFSTVFSAAVEEIVNTSVKGVPDQFELGNPLIDSGLDNSKCQAIVSSVTHKINGKCC